MSELLKRLRKNTIVDAQLLKNSKYFDDVKYIKTRIPFLNLALSGKLKGGIPGGIVQLAAPPKHFKTKFLHEMMFAFQEANKGEDYLIVLYDSELGSTLEYYEQAGLDTSRIDHRVIKSVEELKADHANLLNDIEEGDRVLVCVDSIGMLRSNKETEDAIKDKQVADMTRAKELNSYFRIITAESAIKRVPTIIVNHSYQTLETYSKEVASGGRKTQYAAHTLLFIGKRQEKDKDDELIGFTFPLKAGLSRYVKENSVFPILATFKDGIFETSGMFEHALEMGVIKEASKGWYYINGDETKKIRRSQIEENTDFLMGLLENEEFVNYVEGKYAL